MLYLLAITIMMVSVLFMGAGAVQPANVSNAVMTTGVDDNSEPIDQVSSFPVNTDVYVAADKVTPPMIPISPLSGI